MGSESHNGCQVWDHQSCVLIARQDRVHLLGLRSSGFSPSPKARMSARGKLFERGSNLLANSIPAEHEVCALDMRSANG